MTHPRPPIPDSRRYGIEPYYGPVSDRMARAARQLVYLAGDFKRYGTAYPPLLWRVLHELEVGDGSLPGGNAERGSRMPLGRSRAQAPGCGYAAVTPQVEGERRDVVSEEGGER